MPLKLPSTFTYLCAKKVKLGVPGSSPGRVCTSCNKSLLRLPGFDSNLGPLLLDILSPIYCLSSAVTINKGKSLKKNTSRISKTTECPESVVQCF